MLPIQKFFAEKISEYKLSKTEIAKALSSERSSARSSKLENFFNASEPDYETAKKLAKVLCMSDEEFEELWYQTKDQAVRRKIKARIHAIKLGVENLKVA
jgi:hypothetical protein